MRSSPLWFSYPLPCFSALSQLYPFFSSCHRTQTMHTTPTALTFAFVSTSRTPSFIGRANCKGPFSPRQPIAMTTGHGGSTPPLFVLNEHASSVLCCDFYPSSSYERDRSSWFLSGDVEGSVIVWNLVTRRPLLSFPAVEEARRSINDSFRATRSASDHVGGGQGNATPSVNFAALGPHSRSVVSVGFIPTSAPPSVPPYREAAASNDRLTTHGMSAGSQNTTTQDLVSTVSAPGLLQKSAGLTTAPLRQRFRLSRLTAPRSSDYASSSSVADSSINETYSQRALLSHSSTCFYTHCRDQRVYVWSFSVPTMSLRLMAALTAPQHGFCPAEGVSIVENAVPTTFLAVPHDTNGEVTVWEMQWQNATMNSKDSIDGHEPLQNGSGTDVPARRSDNDEEEVDVAGLNPMDALIARAAAQERRDARQRSAQRGSTSSNPSAEESNLKASADTFAKRMDRGSFLCFVASFATSGESGFSIRRLCTFTACPRFKGGTIMRLTMCSDAEHITVAFESGHVVLARFRVDNTNINGIAQLPKHEVPNSLPSVRCVVRAFAESALASWWSGRRVLACSAEGALHCYEVALASTEADSGEEPLDAAAPLQLQLVWSLALRRGIGSVGVQANLVIAGCWDSTLRLYDARDGRLVSILSYQRDVINDVRVAPAAIARGAAFGFDARQPRCYAPRITQLQVTSKGGKPLDTSALQESAAGGGTGAAKNPGAAEEEELVYLFGSASKDGSVALWRVDMQLVAEKAAMKRMTH